MSKSLKNFLFSPFHYCDSRHVDFCLQSKKNHQYLFYTLKSDSNFITDFHFNTGMFSQCELTNRGYIAEPVIEWRTHGSGTVSLGSSNTTHRKR